MIVSTAEEMNPSKRSTMEDCHVVHEQGSWGCKDDHMSCVGVYDGHGGRDMVDFLEEALVPNIAQELNYKDPTLTEHDNDILIRLERAFLLTDIQSRMAGLVTSGATVAICLIKKKPKSNKITIYAANVGDARAVLSSTSSASVGGKSSSSSIGAVRLTHDHRADDPEEISRIESTGGFVLRNRVLGILAVARSLGDHGMKEYVIGKPHLSTTEVILPTTTVTIDDGVMDTEHNTENICMLNKQFIIIACDGLWDVIMDQEAVDMVRKFVESTSKNKRGKEQHQRIIGEGAAQLLVNEALKRGSTDNITVVVSWL
mmetsp:Transcript_35551/g.51948  ORF Transcript_35551/g.51948 Transcript_35551/m.51948 type:complete len:315 (+) Transcript_35551:167-1111(+)